MGCRPEWYTLIRAGRYLGIPPDRLLEMHPMWLTWAAVAESTEAEVEHELWLVARQQS